MKKLTMPAQIREVTASISSQALRAAAEAAPSYDKPDFAVVLLLAVLNKRNRNGHLLTLAETKAALERMGERPFKPGNFNHEDPVTATSTKLWIEKEDSDFPELYLEGVFWTRTMTEERFNNTMIAFAEGKLGASWEIDNYRLEADENATEPTEHIMDYTIDGWCMTLDVEPAEEGTKGQVSITASAEADDSFWERYWAERERSLYAKALTYEDRQKLKDSDFAYVKTVNGKKVRLLPIDAEERRKVVLSFIPKVKEVSLTNEEKVAIFKKALARGKKEGDAWVEKYADFDVSVFPPKKKTKVAGRGDLLIYPSDNVVDFVRDIPCPTCNSRWNTLMLADYQNGEFVLECDGERLDDGTFEKHRFTVSIVVKPEGKNAEYLLAPQELDEDHQIAILTLREVNSMAEPKTYTEEELKAMVDAEVKKAVDEAVEELKAEYEKAMKDAVAKARQEGVEEYKNGQELIGKRMKELDEVMPLTDEERKDLPEKLAGMTEDRFTIAKLTRETEKYKAEMAGKQPMTASLLPMGNAQINSTAQTPVGNPVAPFANVG